MGGDLTPAVFSMALAGHAGLLMLVALFACVFSGWGNAVRCLMPAPAAPARERRALDLLFGFALLGAANLGLALTGLFIPWILWLLPAGGCLLPGARRFVGAAAGGMRAITLPPWRGPCILALCAVIPSVLLMWVPDDHVDTWSYHYLIPDQLLKSHKYVMDGAPVAFGFPLTAEMVYAPALAAGLDALPHWLQAVPFMAALVQLVWWAERVGGTGTGWMAAALVLTFGEVQKMLPVGKNDLAAAAYPVAGALALARSLNGERGWILPGALLFGMGASVKASSQALAALAFGAVALSRYRGLLTRWVLLAAIPVLPWLLRSYLWWGDPLWPVGAGFLPDSLWGPEDAESVWIVRGRRTPIMAFALGGPELAKGLFQNHPVLAILTPVVIAGLAVSGVVLRWLSGYALAAIFLLMMLMSTEWSRLAIPAFVMWSAVSAVVVRRLADSWPRWVRGAALWGAAGLCWYPPAAEWRVSPESGRTALSYLIGSCSGPEFRARRMTTLDDVRATLERRRSGGRMIAMGDIRFYRLPARFYSVRNYGSTWAWELSRDCAHPGRIQARLRQIGARGVLYNFVTEGFPHAAAEPYAWTDRQILVWREFVERWLDLSDLPTRIDHRNGGFVLYRLRDTPRAQRSGWLPYLPGLESLYYTITSCSDKPLRYQRARAVDARIPDVDWIRNRVADAVRAAKDYELSWSWYATGLLHGSIDDGNFWEGGIAALQTGRYAAAERAFRRAAELRPDLRQRALRLADQARAALDTTGRRKGIPATRGPFGEGADFQGGP